MRAYGTFFVGLALFAILICVQFLFAHFKYEANEDILTMKWYLPGGIRIAKRELQLSNVAEVKRAVRTDHFSRPYTFGNPFSRNRVVLVMRQPYWFIARHVILTPSDPGEVVQMLRQRLAKLSAAVMQDQA